MHTVKIPLKTTEYDRQVIDKRFHALSHIHNVLVKRAKKLLKKLRHDRQYQLWLSESKQLLQKPKLSKCESARKKELTAQMDGRRREIGLTEACLQSYIKICGKQFRKCLSSQQIQKEATRVWRGVERVLFADGEEIHFKKYMDFHTIGGKTNTNGAKFHKEGYAVEWIGLEIECAYPKKEKDAAYLEEALSHDISYCEIERKMFPNGWHYYVIVYLKGNPPRKLEPAEDKENVAGVDIGTSTVATVSGSMVSLEELAPKCPAYNRKIRDLLQHMDASKRISNPENYNPDGTVKKTGCSKWKYSKTYRKNQRRLKSLFRQKAAYIRQSHEELANRLIADSVCFITEEMNFKALQRRSKKTERAEKETEVKTKDGAVKRVRKYKRKKRFGRSLNNRAPAEFIEMLKRKAEQYGGGLKKVDTKKYRASQYDHAADTYKKTELRERSKVVDGKTVQRDLYSAFLLKNADDTLEKPDRRKCIHEFENFIKMADQLIAGMKENRISMKQCFGF